MIEIINQVGKNQEKINYYLNKWLSGNITRKHFINIMLVLGLNEKDINTIVFKYK
jgi:hypothetical protein